jgi:hypothetical protein
VARDSGRIEVHRVCAENRRGANEEFHTSGQADGSLQAVLEKIDVTGIPVVIEDRERGRYLSWAEVIGRRRQHQAESPIHRQVEQSGLEAPGSGLEVRFK